MLTEVERMCNEISNYNDEIEILQHKIKKIQSECKHSEESKGVIICV